MMTKVPAVLLDRAHASVKATNGVCASPRNVGEEPDP
jgi:hypothetical protein